MRHSDRGCRALLNEVKYNEGVLTFIVLYFIVIYTTGMPKLKSTVEVLVNYKILFAVCPVQLLMSAKQIFESKCFWVFVSYKTLHKFCRMNIKNLQEAKNYLGIFWGKKRQWMSRSDCIKGTRDRHGDTCNLPAFNLHNTKRDTSQPNALSTQK